MPREESLSLTDADVFNPVDDFPFAGFHLPAHADCDRPTRPDKRTGEKPLVPFCASNCIGCPRGIRINTVIKKRDFHLMQMNSWRRRAIHPLLSRAVEGCVTEECA